jgi:hypothetical protein
MVGKNLWVGYISARVYDPDNTHLYLSHMVLIALKELVIACLRRTCRPNRKALILRIDSGGQFHFIYRQELILISRSGNFCIITTTRSGES